VLLHAGIASGIVATLFDKGPQGHNTKLGERARLLVSSLPSSIQSFISADVFDQCKTEKASSVAFFSLARASRVLSHTVRWTFRSAAAMDRIVGGSSNMCSL